jgi:TetR/AcrR family hemagglutinin/protease transcriptional regulator
MRPAGAPARRSRAARLPPAERRAQLVGSALRVFARRGLGAARHADVAAEARVSLPAVFVYFPTREALRDAVLDRVERHYLAMLWGVADDGSARATLLAVARAFAASVDAEPDVARVWLNWSTAMRDELWPRHVRFQRRVLGRLTRLIRRGQRDGSVDRRVVPEDAARLMYAAAYAVLQMKLTGCPATRLGRFLRSAVDAVAGHPSPRARRSRSWPR